MDIELKPENIDKGDTVKSNTEVDTKQETTADKNSSATAEGTVDLAMVDLATEELANGGLDNRINNGGLGNCEL